MQDHVLHAYRYAESWRGEGQLAAYIPQLAEVDPEGLAVVVTERDGEVCGVGDTDRRFTVQSIAKILLLAAALRDVGFEQVFTRVGMEPTGDPFNSIIRLETKAHKPLNPMINAGAIAVASCIPGGVPEVRFERLLDYAKELFGSPFLTYDKDTFSSEMEHGDRNRALAYMMRSTGSVAGDVDSHLELYFKACSLWVTCTEISYLGAVLAGGGLAPGTGRRLIDPFYVKAICSLMTTCGLYDASGAFALRVGIPAKSGVGGGIVGAVPGRMGIGVFAPRLDEQGNSVCGIRAMECLSSDLGLSIFSAEAGPLQEAEKKTVPAREGRHSRKLIASGP